MKERFVAIIPLGSNCATSWHLRNCGLQDESLPFDWLVINPLVACRMLEDNFRDFLTLERLEPLPCPAGSHFHRFAMPNGIMFYHDFVHEEPSRDFEAVNRKYQRRISRLLKMIGKAKSILFVANNRKFSLSSTELESLLSRLRKLYPSKKIKLLYMHFDTKRKGFEFVCKTPTLDIVEIEYLTHPDPVMDWLINPPVFNKMISGYGYTWKQCCRRCWNAVTRKKNSAKKYK